jgi:cyanate permease
VPLLLLGIETLGFTRAVLAAGGVTLALLVPLALVVLRWRSPDQLGLRPDGAGAPPEPAPGTPSPVPPRVWTRREAMRSRAFRTIAVGFALALGVQVGFLTHHVALVEPTFGAVGAGLLVGATGVAALLGRMALAVVADGMNVRRLAALAIGIQVFGLVAIAVLPEALVLIAASLVIGFGVGNATTLSPIIVRREFGAGAFGAIYGVAATVIQTGIALGPSLFGVLRDLFGDFGPALLAAAAIDLLAIAVILAGARPDCISLTEASTLRPGKRE